MEKDKEKFKVLFVCTGNSCRSPMAEGILKKMFKEKELDNFEVGSAGISTLNGAPPSFFAMEAAKTRNVDLSQHRSRQLNKQILKRADLILAMSDEHLEYIKGMDKNALNRTYLLKTFPPCRHRIRENHSAQAGERLLAPNKDKKPGVLYIKDPIGGSRDDYERCFSQLEKEIRRIFPELASLASEKRSKSRSRYS
ncbi:MAG: low molecular weight protein arginine phosphatase [Candidatus Zixiibacteriota bacterium]